MFNIGGGEVIVIALIALIVLGPQRLPDAARQAGKLMGDLRRISSGFQNEVRTAFDDHDRTTAEAAPAITPLSPALFPGDADITDSLSAVSAQSAPAAKRSGAKKATPAKRPSAAKKAPAKKPTAKAPAKKAPGKKALAKKTTAKKAPAKAPAKKRSA